MIQKRFVRVDTFYVLQLAHTETELFEKNLTTLKFIEIQIPNFVYSYFQSLLPLIFNNYYFQSTSSIHSYSTWPSINEILSLMHILTLIELVSDHFEVTQFRVVEYLRHLFKEYFFPLGF